MSLREIDACASKAQCTFLHPLALNFPNSDFRATIDIVNNVCVLKMKPFFLDRSEAFEDPKGNYRFVKDHMRSKGPIFDGKNGLVLYISK